jgi:hypothetical protein
MCKGLRLCPISKPAHELHKMINTMKTLGTNNRLRENILKDQEEPI